MLEEALALHAQGRLAEAEQAYRALLARDPDNAEIGHQLGLLALDAGMPQQATPIFERVCMLAPANAAFQANRGLSHMRCKRLPEALEAFDRAIALQPDLFLAHLHRGIVMKDLMRPEEALASFSRAAEIQDEGFVHNYRALVLDELGRYEEARESFGRSLQNDPEISMVQSNYGHSLLRLQRWTEALPYFEKAVALKPDEAGLHYNLGEPLKLEGRLEEAVACYDRAIALAPEMANAYVNRGLVLAYLGRTDAGLADLDRAIALEPDSLGAHIGRSNVLADAGKTVEALAYNRELARNPLFRVEADFLSATLHLKRGEWEEGWNFYETRRALNRYTDARVCPQPEWQGDTPLAGKTLYVHGEQGLGDQIMFARFLSLARHAGAKVIFSPKGRLQRLFSEQGLADELLPWEAAPPAADYHVPLASLPRAFGIRPNSIPLEIPYLKPDPALVEKWRARIGDTGFRIGVCWAGGFDLALGMDRSFPAHHCAALAALPGVRLISLQMPDGSERSEIPAGLKMESLGADFDAGPDAFVDTAAAMASLDLVISCDTAVAHLAGALGRPVWTALKRHAEWRWGPQGSTSGWYPTMTLFRQEQAGVWEPVFAAMRDQLAAMLDPTLVEPTLAEGA